jgi:hypothetical protein
MKRFLQNNLLLVMLLQLGWVSLAANKNISGDGDFSEPLTKQEKSTIVFYEGFELGLQPDWIQDYLTIIDGFTAPWDVRTGAGIVSYPSMYGKPDTAAVGQKNLVFQFQGSGHVTRIITPPINLEFVVNPVLTFYHAQAAWGSDVDQLTLYYRKGEHGNWNFLRKYEQPVEEWTERSISLTDHESDQFYFALEGVSGHGSGVCIDEFTVTETGVIPKAFDNITTNQASLNFIPTGSTNNPILRSTIRVTGNSGHVTLQSYTAHSLNTSDADIDKIKLYYTTEEFFSNHHLVATANGFVDGVVTFSDTGLDLPTGYSYLWLAYDVKDDAIHDNFADAFIPAGGIVINEQSVPENPQSPFGERAIYESIFYDDFDTDKGWILTGEWERAEPMGYGGIYGSDGTNGSHGQPGASYPFVGNKILGTDITGLGAFPGNYEPGIDTLEYEAISPVIDCFYYKDVTLSFHRWLNAEPTDKVWIQITNDEGVTWNTEYINTDFENTLGWTQQTYQLPKANRKKQVRIRFGVGPTDDTNHYSGWNIDNLVVTGTFVNHDVGVTKWLGSDGSCGMSDQETIVVEVKNFGAMAVDADIPIGFSLDGGITWSMDVFEQPLAVGQKVIHTFTPKADFSTPGRYDNIIVKTFWEDDQDDTNDALHYEIFSVPYITPPYSQLFIENDGLWTGYGQNSSWEWSFPTGVETSPAHAGSTAWFTNASGAYNPDEVSWLESPCFNFSGTNHPVIEFYINTHTPEGIDGLGIQYSNDEGLSWQQLGVMDQELAWGWHGDTTQLPSLQTGFGADYGWHGNTPGWQRVRAVLGSGIATQEKIKFRMIFAGDTIAGQSDFWEGIGFDAVSIFEAPHDLGVVAVVDPIAACELSDEQAITVRIQNFGLNTVPAGSQVPVAIEVDELPGVFEFMTLTGDLHPDATVDYTFVERFDVTSTGNHDVVAYTLMPGDTDFYNPGVFNDTLVASLTVYGYPDFTLGDDIYTTQPDTVLLNAGDSYVSYLWHDGSVDSTFQVSALFSDFYSVRVTDSNNCSITDTVEVITRDISVVALTEPLNNCELSDAEYVVAQIQNNGPDAYLAGSVIPVQLYADDVLFDETIITLQQDLLPGVIMQVDFQTAYDFTEVRDYAFTIRQTLPDAGPDNDSILHTVTVYGYPQPNIGDTIYSQDPTSIVLDAGSEYVHFTWQDGFEGQLYSITNPHSAWYNVMVIDQYGCPGMDSALVITYDIEIAEILAPVESCELTNEEMVSVKLINHGPEAFAAGTEFPFVLEFQGELLSQDTLVLDHNWAADEELVFQFSPILDMQNVQSYDFRIFMAYRDTNTSNDTIEAVITVHGYPVIGLPAYVTTNTPDTVVLDPGAGHFAYLWQDGATEQVYHVQTWGLHKVDVSNAFGCISTATTQIYPEVLDMAMDSILSPVSVCQASGENKVVVRIINSGYMVIPAETEVTLSYSLNGGPRVEETVVLDVALEPAAVSEYTFVQAFDAPQGSTNSLEAGIDFEHDEIAENNFITQDFSLNLLPQLSMGGNIYSTDPVGTIITPGDIYESYLWQDGSTEPVFVVQSPETATYSVTVYDAFGCFNTGYVDVVTYNFEMDSVISPRSHCALTNAEKVRVKVYNEGNDTFDAGFAIHLGYKIKGLSATTIQEFVLDQPWPANTFRYFEFQHTADLTTQQQFELNAFVQTPNAVAENDSLVTDIALTGKPQVVLGDHIYTSQPDTILLDAGAGFVSYLWHDGKNEQTHHVNAYGWKWVTVTDQYGCQGADTLYVGLFINVAENETLFHSRVYPNPASGSIQIEFENLPASGAVLELMDMEGRVIISEIVNHEDGFKKRMDLAGVSAGVYYLNVTGSNVRKTHKITVVH